MTARPAGSSDVGTTTSKADRQPETEEKTSQATRIAELALEEYRFGMSTEGLPFAVRLAGPYRALPLSQARGGFKAAVAARYYELYRKVPATNGVNDAMRVLHHHCEQATPEPVALRVGGSKMSAVLDLGTETGEAIVIEPGAWQLIDKSPELFRRTPLTLPLSRPTPDGNLEILRDLINCSWEDWSLLRAVLVAALVPEISHPIVAFTGEQGSGKTTAMRLVCEVLDPGRGGNRAAPTKEDDWAVTANASYFVGVDNVSWIPPWLSDALCRAVSGAAWVKRSLYTDADLSVLELRRVVCMNGIDLGSVRGDLADRLLLLQLDGIPARGRRTDEELRAEFAQSHPEILGGLLDLTARVFERLPFVRVEEAPRLADFAQIVAAVDELTGSRALAHYLGQRQSLDQAVLDSDVFAGALCGWLDGLSEPVELLAGQVLEMLTQSTSVQPPKGWPSTARATAARLRRLSPSLRTLGYRIDEQRPQAAGHKRTSWHLGPRAPDGQPEQPEQPEVSSDLEPNGAVEAIGAISRGTLRPSPAKVADTSDLISARRQVETLVSRVRRERLASRSSPPEA